MLFRGSFSNPFIATSAMLRRRKYFNFLLRIVRVLMQPGKIQEIISSAARDVETRVPCCQDYHGSCLSTNVIFAYAAILNKTVSNTLSFFLMFFSPFHFFTFTLPRRCGAHPLKESYFFCVWLSLRLLSVMFPIKLFVTLQHGRDRTFFKAFFFLKKIK